MHISKIDNQLSIYNKNKVVVLGNGSELEKMISLLKSFKIPIYNIISDDIVYCDDLLINLCKDETDKFVLQIALKASDEELLIKKMSNFEKINYIATQEAFEILGFMRKFTLAKETNSILETKFIDNNQINRHKVALYSCFLNNQDNLPVVMCLPPKTADYTIKGTFDYHSINIYALPNQPRAFDKELYMKMCDKIKIITAVREPIGQNLSLVFQFISTLNSSRECDTFSICESIDKFFDNGGDAQYVFDTWLKSVKYLHSDDTRIISGLGIEQSSFPFNIQRFIPEFQKNIMDILSHPFDKEKGYAIMKEDNLEVFVYQLEKLNDIVPELSEWVGVPFDKLENDNIGEAKWSGAAYKKAQKELKITREYFDKCFNEPYVKHFYSDDDIEKFKNRWSSHIID